jgi:hypothetical protein
MPSIRTVSVVLGHALFLGVCVAVSQCGGNNYKSPGVTNLQPPDRCLSRGTGCTVDNDCCSLWCPNGHCATRQP